MPPFDRTSTAEEVTAGLDLAGRHVLVTGVTSGIGREILRVLALRGAHVLGTGRTLAAAQAACAAVPGRATPLALDLADFDAVVDCATRVAQLGVPLDALVCNAGIMALPRLELVRGLEKQFVVNHLGHFILVCRLLDRVRAAPQGRVVMVSSSAHRFAPPGGIDFDNLGGERGYAPRVAYGRSKLANALVAMQLARRLAGTPATANAVHPGLILTGIVRYLPWWQRALLPAVGWLAKSAAQGAATPAYVATHPDLAPVSGCYFADCARARPEPIMESDRLAERLWQVSTELARPWLAGTA
jgi:NAD(P)-dependent dehydrogenase (short-subunit alcohol dehydrogenase family)